MGNKAEINAEKDGGACGNGEGGEGDGIPSAYLNLNGNDEVIYYRIYVSSSNPCFKKRCALCVR